MGSVCQFKAFDTMVLTGVKPTGVLLDELHEITKVAAAERIIGQPRAAAQLRRRYRFNCCKKFRLRDARSDGAGQGIAGAGRSTDVAGRRARVPA
jgi:hypothetical protein